MQTAARLREQQHAIVRLASRPFPSAAAAEAGLAEVTAVAADILDVGRVGIWLFAEDGKSLRCIAQTDRGGDVQATGTILAVEEYPAYFAALADERHLVVDDARRDPRTAELAAAYLPRHRIGALLDTPIRVAGGVRGIVCCEHVGGVRLWTEDEQGFAAATADIVALTLEGIERLRAEEALRERERRFRAIFDCTPIGALVIGRDGTIEDANSAIADLLHTEPRALERTGFFDLIHPEDAAAARDELVAVFDDRTACAAFEHRVLRGAEVVLVRTTAALVSTGNAEGSTPSTEAAEAAAAATEPLIVAMVENITTRRAAQRAVRESEARLYQAQKMDAVGRLAGEAAVEFTNLLTVIRSSAQLALRALPADGEAREHVEEVDRTARAAGELTRRLLALSRRQPTMPRLLDLNVVLERLRAPLRQLLGPAVTLEVTLAPDLGLVHADESEVEQIVRILADNARASMPGGGRVAVTTCNVSMPPRDAARGHAPVPHACIRVADTGIGIDPETVRHLFEPYYTTSEMGQGTGLGLSTAYAMARRNGGDIQVETTLGEGSTFTICLRHA